VIAAAARPGATLVELVVVLAMLGVMAIVATPALRRADPAPAEGIEAVVRRVRMQAIQRGTPATESFRERERLIVVTAWPNGLLLADSTSLSATAQGERTDAQR
jgi:Tfp pilus assembly protein FimT